MRRILILLTERLADWETGAARLRSLLPARSINGMRRALAALSRQASPLWCFAKLAPKPLA